MATLSLLLVDDEKPLLALLQRFLERAGYTVDVAETGMDALNKCRRMPCPYHVAVLDLKLPDISGHDLLPMLLGAAPFMKIMVSSGSPFSAESLPPDQRPRVSSLLKPFMPRELVDAIERLARRSRAASV